MLCRRLKALRLAAGKTQQELADALRISRSAYALYETGKRQLNYEALTALADYYHISLDYLFGRTTVREQPEIYSQEVRQMVRQYSLLDARGKGAVRCLLEYELRQRQEQPPSQG